MMRCLDRVRVRAALIVVGLTAAAILLWNGSKVRRTYVDDSPEQPTLGEVVSNHVKVQIVLEEIRLNDIEINRLRSKIGELEHTYSQPRL